MLTAETKRRIQSARDILVGQLPLPTDQVELITIALIYKFMDDIDEEARSIGGKASFFTGDLRDLSWRHIISNTLSADARVIKITQGIEAISDPKNTQIPELFKSIFRNAFLKFRDGRTLKLFLDEINGFTYDHSEELGNAFEFILESMGVQADNGQFRTPRNIIEFIVDVVDPQKDETILDPACGTAGFLISAYKHILEANTSSPVGDEVTSLKSKPGNSQRLLTSSPTRKVGDLLKGNQRDKLTRNVVGYDITPLMCRLSRVNMYLHHFSDPVIHEYDTLTNKNRWDDKFTVILANPPFMTPKGGIRPHDRFAISANRSEVLFVDYIAEHLNPAGRAGIIVPEGIIFQSQNAYKELRRMLVDGFLWAVVSLPAGVFNPYSGVKTSILFLDRTLAKQNDEVLFVKVENDGFGLGAQRREIELNDFPEALKIIQKWKRDHKVTDGKLAHAISRKRILESPDISLSGDRYRAVAVRGNGGSKWPVVKLGDVCKLEKGASFTRAQAKPGYVPVIAGGQTPSCYHAEANRQPPVITVSASGAYAGFVNYFEVPIFASDCTTIVSLDEQKVKTRFVFEILKGKQDAIYETQKGMAQPHVYAKDLIAFEIPMPPMAEQERLVAELDGYRRVIESARQILAHYKPTFLLDSKWPQRPLNEVCEQITDGTHLTPPLASKGIPMLDAVNINGEFQIDDSSPRKFISKETDAALAKRCKPKSGDILISSRGTIGKIAIVREGQDFNIMGNIILLRPNQSLLASHYLAVQLLHLRESIESNAHGVAQKGLYLSTVRDFTISVPPLAEQRALVAELETERALVEANRELAVRFEQKLQTKLSEIWGAG
jgi:type I restriction enzyme M protein